MKAIAIRLATLTLATLLMWAVLSALPWPARALTSLLLVPLPALMLAQLRLLSDTPPDLPRMSVYSSSAATLWLLAAIAYVAARWSGFTPRLMGLFALPPVPLAAWTLAGIAGLLVLLILSRVLNLPETNLLAQLIPRSTGEKVSFAAVSITAGVAEELVFRGFLIPALAVVTGSVWPAAIVSSAVFGLLHTYQGLIGSARAAVMGVGLATPYLVSGSLLPSMAAHAIFNIVAGVWLADWFLRR